MRRFLFLMLIFFTAGCRVGGGSSSSSSAASAGALDSAIAGFGAAFQAVSVGVTGAFTEGIPSNEITDFKHTLLCDTSGPENEGTSNIETRIGDRTTEGTFFVSSNLKNCNDVDGDLSAVGNFQRGAAQVTLAWTYSGAIRSGDCDVDLSDLTVSSTQEGAAAASFVSGDLSATCTAGATVTCRWNQTPAMDEATLLSECSCSGSGC